MQTHGHSEGAGLVPRVALVVLLVAATVALCGGHALSASGILDGKTFVGETGESIRR